jgi:hypothetical protein
MMAFERLEPFGSLHDEQMAGMICAVSMNPHLKKNAEPRTPSSFFPALAKRLGFGKPIELTDKMAHSKLIAAKLFGGLVTRGGRRGR